MLPKIGQTYRTVTSHRLRLKQQAMSINVMTDCFINTDVLHPAPSLRAVIYVTEAVAGPAGR